MELSSFSSITILIADDHPLFRKGLSRMIKQLGFEGEILEARHGDEVLALRCEHDIDLYILDYSMPLMNGYDAAKVILRTKPRAKIIIMSMYDDLHLLTNFQNVGIKGFINKNSEPEQVKQALTAVLSGREHYPIVDRKATRSVTPPLQFTPREMELIQLLAKGHTTRDIARLLNLTQKTVETYRCRLLEKVNVKNTSELLSFVYRIGVVQSSEAA